jgi:hypothetical protein
VTCRAVRHSLGNRAVAGPDWSHNGSFENSLHVLGNKLDGGIGLLVLTDQEVGSPMLPPPERGAGDQTRWRWRWRSRRVINLRKPVLDLSDVDRE